MRAAFSLYSVNSCLDTSACWRDAFSCDDRSMLYAVHTHTQPFTGRWSGTTWVGWYQKKLTHSHPSWSSNILYQLPPFTTIHSILCVQFTCLTVFFEVTMMVTENFGIIFPNTFTIPLLCHINGYLKQKEFNSGSKKVTFSSGTYKNLMTSWW